MKQWSRLERSRTSFSGDPLVLLQRKLKYAKQSKLYKYVPCGLPIVSSLCDQYFIRIIYSNSQKFENSKRNWNCKMSTTKSCCWKWRPSNAVLNKELVCPAFTTRVRGKNQLPPTKKYKRLQNRMHQVPETIKLSYNRPYFKW